MSGGKFLGFFEGETGLYLVQTAGSALNRSSVIPLPAGEENEDVAARDIRITGLIQKAVRADFPQTNQVKLSIPSSQAIIRSFTVPFMRQSEIDAGIEFEIKKQVPFSLETVVYSYNSIPFEQDGVTKMLIIFATVQRSYVEKYAKIMEQAGLSLVFSEPAPVSAVRALLAKKLILANQKIAVLQLETSLARILFLHEGTIIFTREFPLTVPSTEEEPIVKSRFINEVRNSFEFFNRQYSLQPAQLLVLSSAGKGPHEQWLKDDLTVAVKSVEVASVTGQPMANQMGTVNAFGACLANEVKTRFVFDFSRKKAAKSALMPTLSFDVSEYVNTIKTAVGAAVVLGGIFLLTQVGLSGAKKSVDELSSRQGGFSDQNTEDIKTKIERSDTNLKTYKGIPVKSNVTNVFVSIAASLPQGIWLRSFDLRSAAPKEKPEELGWNLDIGGYAYTEDPNQEISLVYELVSKIKKDKYLAEFVKNVTLISLQREEIRGKAVVSFHLDGN